MVIRDEAEARVVYGNGYFGNLVYDGKVEDKARLVMEDWTPGLDKEVVKEGEVDKVEQQASSWSEVKSHQRHHHDKNAKVELHLELCEAFFLSYSLGCLVVKDVESGQSLSLVQQWKKYSQLEPDFPVRYRVYHHYRSKGWVVRSGLLMGGDWVLYKLSPSHYHSTYVVRIEVVDSKTGDTLSNQNQSNNEEAASEQSTNQKTASEQSPIQKTGISQLTWSDILGHTRVMGTVKKDLLLVRVSVPSASDLTSPQCLHSMAVTSHRIRRWVPGEHRWKVKPTVPVLTIE